MRIERSWKQSCFAELVDTVPLSPIEDERSYERAMQVLDRLFLLKREQNRDEREYFRALAEIVYEYESQNVEDPKHTKDLNRIDHLDHGLNRKCLQTEKCC
jgi:antitoxin component HigA of HigAB toxin-antitoxin module